MGASLRFPRVSGLASSTSQVTATKKTLLDSRASVDNCAKKLFSSPGTKRGFTRHPSLIKLAKSIQDDRRKINSPTSPVRSVLGERPRLPGRLAHAVSFMNRALTSSSSPLVSSSGDSSNTSCLNKMAQLAAICKIELDQKSP